MQRKYQTGQPLRYFSVHFINKYATETQNIQPLSIFLSTIQIWNINVKKYMPSIIQDILDHTNKYASETRNMQPFQVYFWAQHKIRFDLIGHCEDWETIIALS